MLALGFIRDLCDSGLMCGVPTDYYIDLIVLLCQLNHSIDRMTHSIQ